MQLQFKEQQFQIDAVNAIVNCFAGQLPKENHYTLELSRALIRKTKEAATGVQTLEFDTEIQTAIGYRNAEIKISESQILTNIQLIQKGNEIKESNQLERARGTNKGINLTIEMETGTGKT